VERTALQKLTDWDSNKRKKPLIVWGARQVGKTYLILELFAKKYYPNRYVYVDCKKEDEIRAFCSGTANAEKIIEYISLRKGQQLNEQTLLIFDEVQECPNILSSLKYFCQDYREIPVIATGSMVRIKLQRETHKRGARDNDKFLFPVGKINQMTVYPMTFDEFLMNSNQMLFDAVQNAYERRQPLERQIHELVMEHVYKYLLVGGMPEAVEAYIDGGSLLESREILKVLYDNYLADMELYQASQESVLRSRALFQNIYRELNRESKNFSPGLIEEKSKTRDYATSIQWLTMAHVVNQSFQLKEHVTMPLMPDSDSSFRLFLGDIGMFSYQSGINAASFVSSERENTLSGIFFENFVANELIAKEHKLFYWRGKSSAELEFIVESDNRLYPIDVKKGRGTLNSLEKFSNHNKFEYAIKVSKNNYGYDREQKLLTIPLYFIPFVAKDLADGKMRV
jgi:predicted AAA+ superfamily ATPase